MATIEDVARLAGLSRTTVSRVINDQPYVTEEKKEKIMDAMHQLGYVPNSSARRLRSQRTETIAVLLPRVTNPFFGHLIEAMEREASEFGYQVIVCQTHDKKQKELDYLQLLKTKQVDGVIMASLSNDWKTIEPYLESGPIVLCNEYMETDQVSMVHIDHRQAAYDATVHLIEQGCSTIAYATGSQETHITCERKLGFQQALADFHLPFDENLEIKDALDVKDGQKVFAFLQQQNKKVDGIFTGSDEVAAGIVYAAAQSGFSIPEDLSVVGFDNQMISLLMVPSITTVQQPVAEMAMKTIQVLVNKMKSSQQQHEQRFVYPYELLKRKSTERISLKESASS
ncbi:LacI family transcriptional regulator [Halobacillus andaensis]|uniref:LacI family transcriptional regulator n=1 Tax=Halobacillus andaensis TaxID=1176239 RepID=A0A917B2M8_HALAA|nr:LacI family DNA-binding transcriptional regulator [Halobacillus andaensis]MBP2004110.1 DNA-binding LacI/PurR family transcriptional regulator [Halobacillus andaensis]GGF15879.1 LacI family transcriptional regulator [Halobacillus andaensis]